MPSLRVLPAAVVLLSCTGSIPDADGRRFARLPAPPDGDARVYVYQVGSGDGVAEEIWINDRPIGTITRGWVGLRPYCEYAAATVPAGNIQVRARMAGAFGGGVQPDTIGLELAAKNGGHHYVRLRTESSSATFGSSAKTTTLPVISSAGHGLEVVESDVPPPDLARCFRPQGADAAAYDQLVLDEVLACLDSPSAGSTEFSAGVCDCWSRHAAPLGERIAVSLRAGAEGRVEAIRSEPEGPLSACLIALRGSRIAAPPDGSREITIHLEPN